MKEEELKSIEPNKRDFDQRMSTSQDCSSCGKIHRVYHQDDYDPEYYTDIYVVCECGELVEFVVPVN